MVPEYSVYNVNAAVHNVNGGVYKANEQLLNSLSTRVNKTHATFTNVNAAAPNAGGDVSRTSQVRSAYFHDHSTKPEIRYRRDRDMRWESTDRRTEKADVTCGFENASSPRSDKIKRLGAQRYGKFATSRLDELRLPVVRKVSEVFHVPRVVVFAFHWC